ncbi:MAG TPA: DUF2834 domain-containing protein [Coleofasciculaceae cyanobacterium]|jgi:hypothetical protein
MSRKITFWLIWVGFIAYVFFLAPPIQPDTLKLLQNLFTGQWQLINPIVLSVFNLVGICLLMHSCLLFFDGRMQKIPAWPFALASVGTGVVGLLPYLALREPNQDFSGSKDTWLKLLDSRWTGVILSVSAIAIIAYGLVFGDWENFVEQYQTSRFINAMSLAVCLLVLLFPALLGDDMARRGLKNSQLFWAVALVPLVGSLLYLCLRPSLSDSGQEVATGSQQPASN